jgi:hypothetical protein
LALEKQLLFQRSSIYLSSLFRLLYLFYFSRLFPDSSLHYISIPQLVHDVGMPTHMKRAGFTLEALGEHDNTKIGKIPAV